MIDPKAAKAAKLPRQLVPPVLEEHAALAMKEGAEKYGAYNWYLRPVTAMGLVGAIRRHLAAYQQGEDLDPDSAVPGKTHLGGIAASVAILLDAARFGTLTDDRPSLVALEHRFVAEKTGEWIPHNACTCVNHTHLDSTLGCLQVGCPCQGRDPL